MVVKSKTGRTRAHTICLLTSASISTMAMACTMLTATMAAMATLGAGAQVHTQVHMQVQLNAVFRAGELNPNGLSVHAYRIPGFVATANGTAIVLAEARKYSCADQTPHDLVAKRSTDGGLNWGPMQMVVEPGVVWGRAEGGPKGGAVYDPTPVLAAEGGRVHVIFSYCPARCFN